jgi:hypothetical protein
VHREEVGKAGLHSNTYPIVSTILIKIFWFVMERWVVSDLHGLLEEIRASSPPEASRGAVG